MSSVVKKVGFTLLCLLMLASTAKAYSGRTFYVDAIAGHDERSGRSPGLAWKSIGTVNANRFRSGDHLYFHAGQEFGGTFRPQGSGTAGAPVVVDSYSDGHAPRLVGDGSLATVLLVDTSFWTIRNIEITNDGREEAKRTGILLEATKPGEIVRGITVEHVHVYNVRGLTGEDNSAKDTGGIGIFVPALERPARFDGVLIKGCTIEHVDNIGIWLNSYPALNPIDARWYLSRNDHIHLIGNSISDTGRNAIILRQSLAPLIEGNTVTHSSARHHGNAIFTRSTRNAVIRGNQVSFTGTEPSGENAAFDADIDSFHTVIEDNWTHDNEGGLFSLCNNPNEDSNITKDTVVRFNVSENDGVRAFGFSGRVTHSIIYNNTVLISAGHKEAIVEARPFSRNKPRFADDALFFNNAVIVVGESFYDFEKATNMRFDSNCFIGGIQNPLPTTREVSLPGSTLTGVTPADTWQALSAYKAAAKVCGPSSHRIPKATAKDIAGVRLHGLSFRGALQP